MAIKSVRITTRQTFIVSFDDEMLKLSDIMNEMEFTTFPNADAYEFVDGTTDFEEEK
jgi:hypothetical protein